MKTIITSTLLKTLMLSFTFFYSFSLFGQDPDLPSWSFDNGLDSGWVSNPVESVFWEWVPNGKANGGNYWGDRDSIISSSLGGAVVFNADKWHQTLNHSPDELISFTASLTSPLIDISNVQGTNLYLKFNQYYRGFNARTTVRISGKSKAVNEDMILGHETTPDAVQVIDLSEFIGNPSIQITFIFEGVNYFWLLDDIELTTDNPRNTRPNDLIPFLETGGYPYLVDSLGGAYVPNEYVVKYRSNPIVPETRKQQIRDSFNIIGYTTCSCNADVELWHYDPDTGTPVDLNDQIFNINEIKKNSSDTSAIQEIDFNHYSFSELISSSSLDADSLFKSIPFSDTGVIKIVIMDTGIDYTKSPIKDDIWKGTSNCEGIGIDTIIGWDFVGDNLSYENGPEDAFPMDAHSHGTHVAGIVMKNLENCNCDYKLIPVRTHDVNGISTMFDVACAFYFSIEHEADFINASFGYHGILDTILEQAINDALQDSICVITSSGNDSLNLMQYPHYPANFGKMNSTNAPQVITVGSLDSLQNGKAEFSNFSDTIVDYYAKGWKIMSFMPGNRPDEPKTGTSMAAPYITAMAVLARCAGHKNVKKILDQCTKTVSYTSLPIIDPLCVVKDFPPNDNGGGGSGGILYFIGLLFALMMAVLYGFQRRKKHKGTEN